MQGRIDPLVVHELAYLDEPVGCALRTLVRQLSGVRWAWRRERQSRKVREAQPVAKRLEIPIDATWMSKHPDLPVPFEKSGLECWIRNGGFWLWNDGCVVLDFSRVSGVGSEPATDLVSDLVHTVLRVPTVWSVVGSYEGYFQVRVRGSAKAWLSSGRSVTVVWRKLRNGHRVAEVIAKASTSATGSP